MKKKEQDKHPVYEYLDTLQEKKIVKYYGFKKHCSELIHLIDECYCSLTSLILGMSSSEKGMSVINKVDVIRQNWPDLFGVIRYDTKISSDQICEMIGPFLQETYISPEHPEVICSELIKLSYILNFFKINHFSCIPYIVQLKLDSAISKVLYAAGEAEGMGSVKGLQFNDHFKMVANSHVSRKKKSASMIPHIIKELEKYLSERGDIVKDHYENYHLVKIEKRLQDKYEEENKPKNKGLSVSKIKPIIRKYFKDKNENPPWKIKKASNL